MNGQQGRTRARFGGAGLRQQVVLGFAILALLLITGICLFFYYSIRESAFAVYREKVQSAVQIAAAEIDGDQAAGYLRLGRLGPEFEQTDRKLKQIKQLFGLKYLYLFQADAQQIYYIYETVNSGDDMASVASLGQKEAYSDNQSRDKILAVLASGRPGEQLDVTRDGYGYLVSAYAPVLNSQGQAVAVMGADYDMDAILAGIIREIVSAGAAVAAITAVFLTGYGWYIDRRMVRPLRQLTQAAGRIVSLCEQGQQPELTGAAWQVSGRRDEIGELEQSFYQMTLELHQHIRSLEAVTAAKQKIEAELNVAKNIQDMLLPKIFPPFKAADTFAIYASLESAKEVGGDYYDFYLTDEDHICITIADVSGKGVPSALFMVVAKTIMKNQAMLCASPAEVLYRTNELLSENNEEGMFVTAFFAVLQISTGKLTYANAGHNPPLLYRQGGDFEFLPVPKSLVLAAMEGVTYSEYETVLGNGDILFTYTDGVSEAANVREELYSAQRLRETLNAVSDKQLPLRELLAIVRRSVAEHAQGAEQSDDITMLGLRRGGRV